MAADRKHIELWQALVRDEKRKQDAEVEKLRTQISGLQQELSDRPERVVERYIDLDELRKAQDEAERAFRSREKAWQALCEIRLIHREGNPGRCRCGVRLDSCKIAQIVDRYPGLEKWEKEQINRLRNYEDHRLPDGHPAVLDPTWQP